jgi:hypothetical protein
VIFLKSWTLTGYFSNSAGSFVINNQFSLFIILDRGIWKWGEENIPHIQPKCEKYSIEYCQSHTTLLWVWIMLWTCPLSHILFNSTNWRAHQYLLHIKTIQLSTCSWVGDYNQIVKGGRGKDDGDKDSQVYSLKEMGWTNFGMKPRLNSIYIYSVQALNIWVATPCDLFEWPCFPFPSMICGWSPPLAHFLPPHSRYVTSLKLKITVNFEVIGSNDV